MPEEYIGAEDAAHILRVSSRMVYRYAEGDRPKIRSQKAGRRVLFNHADVLAYAEEISAANKPAPTTDIIRAEEAMGLLRETATRAELYARRIGELESQLKMLPPPEQHEQIKLQLHDAERDRDRYLAERDELATKLQQADRRPWWRRLLGI